MVQSCTARHEYLMSVKVVYALIALSHAEGGARQQRSLNWMRQQTAHRTKTHSTSIVGKKVPQLTDAMVKRLL